MCSEFATPVRPPIILQVQDCSQEAHCKPILIVLSLSIEEVAKLRAWPIQLHCILVRRVPRVATIIACQLNCLRLQQRCTNGPMPVDFLIHIAQKQKGVRHSKSFLIESILRAKKAHNVTSTNRFLACWLEKSILDNILSITAHSTNQRLTHCVAPNGQPTKLVVAVEC